MIWPHRDGADSPTGAKSRCHTQDIARRLIGEVQDCLAHWLIQGGDIELVGSTAVQGLPSKPVIDLLGPVASSHQAESATDGLSRLGWELVPPRISMDGLHDGSSCSHETATALPTSI